MAIAIHWCCRASHIGAPMDSNFPSMVMPHQWPEGQVNGNRQQYQQLWHFDGLHPPVWERENNLNFVTPEISLMSSGEKTPHLMNGEHANPSSLIPISPQEEMRIPSVAPCSAKK
ncbi:hypothetical protein CsSME_00045595 [Camellia sinensis var. sinensis]